MRSMNENMNCICNQHTTKQGPDLRYLRRTNLKGKLLLGFGMLIFGTHGILNSMENLFLLFPPSREVARQEIWAKQNWGERKLTIFSALTARRTDSAAKSSFSVKTGTGTSYYTRSSQTNFRIGASSFSPSAKTSLQHG